MAGKTEDMLDMENDKIEVFSVASSINMYPTVYVTVYNDTLATIAILDLEKLDQLIVLLQNARQRITEE